MSIENNKELVRRWIAEGVNGNDLAIADEVFDPYVIVHTPQGDFRGVMAGPKASVARLRESFADVHLEIEDTIAEDDRVAVRWSASGTHAGDFMGNPATGRQVAFTGIYVYRIAEARISEVWVLLDLFGLLQQVSTDESSTERHD